MVLKEPSTVYNPKQEGLKTEMQCQTYFIERDMGVSVPLGDNLRYDIIVDYKGMLFRVQVKKASMNLVDSNIISFSCRSCTLNTKGCKNSKYNADEIDCFATFWDGQCYIIPVQEASATKNLHLGSPKNHQKKGINIASDYIAEKQLEKMYLKRVAKQAALAFCIKENIFKNNFPRMKTSYMKMLHTL